MSRVLAELLQASEPDFTLKIRKLERESHHDGVDVELISEISTKSKRKLKELGLDPADTTGEELYQSLQALVATHENFLIRSAGIKSIDKPKDKAKKIADALNKTLAPNKAWLLKHSTAKKHLKSNPPKKVMKKLGYRSVDSLLKRENVDQVYAAALLVESQTWQDKLVKSYKSLTPMDFEQRKIDITTITNKKWDSEVSKYIAKTHQNILEVVELGIIIVLPIPSGAKAGAVILSYLGVLEKVNDIRIHSSLYKSKQVSPDFSSVVVKSLKNKEKLTLDMAGEKLSWDIVHRHFGHPKSSRKPDAFTPHIQADDLLWHKAESILYRIEPALKFWEEMDYCALDFQGQPVSYSLLDNAICLTNKLAYGQRYIDNFQRNLWDEVMLRYLGKKPLEELAIEQLDSELAELELSEI